MQSERAVLEVPERDVKPVKTSIFLSPWLAEEIKVWAIRHKMSMGEAIDKGCRLLLEPPARIKLETIHDKDEQALVDGVIDMKRTPRDTAECAIIGLIQNVIKLRNSA